MGRLLRRHGAFLLLWAAACVTMLRFAWGEGIATVSDDSVSYLVLAQSFAGDASPSNVPAMVSFVPDSVAVTAPTPVTLGDAAATGTGESRPL